MQCIIPAWAQKVYKITGVCTPFIFLESQTAVREKLVSILQSSIKLDVETREQVKNILLEIYAEDWKSFIRSSLGKIAIFVWTVITLIISAIINSYLP